MKKVFPVVFSVMLLAGVVMLASSEAQLVNVNSTARRVVGREAVRLDSNVYKVRGGWLPGSLAVYVDGKRYQRGVDYTVAPVIGEITFDGRLTADSVVICDFYPR